LRKPVRFQTRNPFHFQPGTLFTFAPERFSRSPGIAFTLPRNPQLAREAGRLNTIRLDVRKLTECVDNSIKFLSDIRRASTGWRPTKSALPITAGWWMTSWIPLGICTSS